MTLILTNLRKAVDDLTESLEISRSPIATEARLFLQFKKACIQSFEFTYDESKKIMRRYLEEIEAMPKELKPKDFERMISLAYQLKLIKNNGQVWERYRQLRNNTSHNYNQVFADEVYATIPGFLEDARYLLHRLEENLNG